MVFILPDGEGGGHDDHRRTARSQRGGLHRRLDADDGQSRVELAQQADGCAGGGVAGHHDSFDPLLQQPVHGGEGQGPDLVQGLFPIGGVGGIPEKEKIFLGQQAHAGAENADAAQTGVKDPDGTGLGFHIPSPSLLAGGWMRAIAVLRYYTTIFPAAP